MADIKKIILPSGAEYNFRDDSKVPLSDLLDLVYPVGSIYMSVNNTSPETFLGGEWAPINGRFLVAQGNNGASGNEALNLTAGSSGGSKNAVIVSHTHKPNGTTYPYFLQAGVSVQSGDMGSQSGSGRHYPFVATTTAAKYWATSSNTADATNGVSGTNMNLPPYLAVYMWKRVS